MKQLSDQNTRPASKAYQVQMVRVSATKLIVPGPANHRSGQHRSFRFCEFTDPIGLVGGSFEPMVDAVLTRTSPPNTER